MINAIREQIEWRRMKKVASAHPFFGMKGRLLSKRNAKALLRGREIPDGYEVIRQTRIELGIPDPVSAACKAAQTGKTPVFALRRGIVTIAIIIAVGCFFTLTKPGIALAESIYKVIVRIINGELQSHSEGAISNTAPIDFSAMPTKFDDLAEVAMLTKRPIIISGNDDDILSKFSAHIIGDESIVVKSVYMQDNGATYTIVQSLYNDFAYWGGAYSAVDGEVETVELNIGITAYLSIMEDGAVYAEAYGFGYDVNVCSNNMTIGDMQNLVLSLSIVE